MLLQGKTFLSECILEPFISGSGSWNDVCSSHLQQKSKVFWPSSESLKRFYVSSRKGKNWSVMTGLSLQLWLNGWFHWLSTSLEVISQTHPSGFHCFPDIKHLQTWLNWYYSMNYCWLIQPMLPEVALGKNRIIFLPLISKRNILVV